MKYRSALKSKDKHKVMAFIGYADETEGMIFSLTRTSDGRYAASTVQNYDPQVMRALVRNFKEDYPA